MSFDFAEVSVSLPPPPADHIALFPCYREKWRKQLPKKKQQKDNQTLCCLKFIAGVFTQNMKNLKK